MPFLQIKNFFMAIVVIKKVFRLLDTVSKVDQILKIFKEKVKFPKSGFISDYQELKRFSQIGEIIQVIDESCIDCKVHS